MIKKGAPFLVFILLGLQRPSVFQYELIIHSTPSELPALESLEGRLDYEQTLTADPKTGRIPEGIHQASIAYARRSQRNIRGEQAHLVFESQGPLNVGGRTRAVAFDTRDENIILAGGVSGGVWKSLDGGRTWTRKSDPLNRNSVTCLVQDTRPGKEDTWYHGTGEIVGNSARGGGAPFRGNGIYKSIDNGETWQPIASTQDATPENFNSQFQYIWGMVTNPDDLVEDELIVAAYGGILRSIDGGDSWEAVLGQSLFNLNDTIDLNNASASFYTSISRGYNDVFYASLSTATLGEMDSPEAGVYVSQDGQNWTSLQLFTNDAQYRRVVIGHSPSDPSASYLLVDANPTRIIKHRLIQLAPTLIQAVRLRETPDLGGDLGDFNTQGSYNMVIKVHPQDPEVVYAGGTNLYRTSDGFATIENVKWVGGYDPSGATVPYEGHHPDQHDLLFYPSNPNKLLSASDGGLRISEDGMADSVIWQSLNNGFLTSQFYTLAQSKVEGSSTLLGGMQDHGTDISGAGKAWKGIIGGDGSYVATTTQDLLWYASFQNGQVLRLTLNEASDITSFARVDPADLVAATGTAPLFINPFVLDPANENRMFYAGGAHLYFHPNLAQIAGGTQVPSSFRWERVTEGLALRGSISALSLSASSEKLFFGTTNGELFSVDAAQDFAKFEVDSLPQSIFPIDGYISCIATDPEDDMHLLVVFSNYNVPSLYESRDGGASFQDVSGNMEENPDGTGSGPSVRWAQIIPTQQGRLYAIGTSTGLYTSEELSASTLWMRQSETQMGATVVPMMDYRAVDGRLAIATHGNGVFTTQIPDFKRLEPGTDASTFQIVNAYPNPFQSKTTIGYTLPEEGIVKVDICSVKGETLATLLWAPQFAGYNEVTWSGINASGGQLASGLYFYKVTYNQEVKLGRLIIDR